MILQGGSMEKLWNSNYKKVMVAHFTMQFAFYLLTPLLPLYLSESFGSTKDMIGLVLSGYTITALLLRPFSGYVVDSFARKKVLLICLSLYFIFFGGYLLASSLLMFAIVRTLHGGPYGASTVANNTVAIDVLPSSRRNEGIGYYGLSNNLAMAIAPTISVFVYKYVHNFDVLFWLAFVVAGLGLWVDYTVKLPEKQLLKDKKALSLDRFFLLKGWMIGLNICAFGFCYGVLSNYLAIYGKEVMGITSGTGTYFMLLSIGLILSRLQGAKSLREGKLTHNAAGGIVLSTIGYTLFIAMPNMIGYYGSAILIGLGNGHMWPAMQNMIINVAHNNERGTANSTLLTSWDLGIGLGILAGGTIAEFAGYASAFWTMAAIHVVGFALFFMGTRQFFLQRKRTASFS
ncbi:MAG: MFS transporter [Bacteroidaceae bacterium]|nr:MFS transporter [Bacteroidaceae bacterium]